MASFQNSEKNSPKEGEEEQKGVRQRQYQFSNRRPCGTYKKTTVKTRRNFHLLAPISFQNKNEIRKRQEQRKIPPKLETRIKIDAP